MTVKDGGLREGPYRGVDSMSAPVAVDLFCGVGGLTHGLQKAGIDVRAGIDVEETCRYPYTANNDGVAFKKADISETETTELADFIDNNFPNDRVSILAGCAPCQPFSPLSHGNIEKSSDHQKWGLLSDFGEVVSLVEPDIVTMENVPQLVDDDIFDTFSNSLEDEGYYVSAEVVDCREYGVPQERSRLVLLASREGHIELTDATHSPGSYVTVGETFEEADLQEIEAGGTADDDRLHRAQGLSKTNEERIRHSKQGGTWRDWPEDLLLACHKKESGRKYTSNYGRMDLGEPAPTMTTQFYNYGSGRFGHPVEDRPISIREGALLQTFPVDYEFFPAGEDPGLDTLGRLIGNAVPVDLARAIGVSIQQHVSNEMPQRRLTSA